MSIMSSRTWGVGLLVSVTLAACGASPPPEPAAPPRPAPSLADLTDAMCACKDDACVTKVHAEFAAVERAAKDDPSAHAAAERERAAACEQGAHDGDDLAMMGMMKAAMCACTDLACVERVMGDFKRPVERLTEKLEKKIQPDQRLLELRGDVEKCEQAVYGDESTADPPAAPSVAGGPYDTGITECDMYMRAFDEYMSCDKIPQEARDAAAPGIAEMKQGWVMLKDPSLPAEAKLAAADGCWEALDALGQSAQAMGCPVAPHGPRPARVAAPLPAKPRAKHHAH